MVFKGSLYIFNLLCGIVPCEHIYTYPDISSEFANGTTNTSYEAYQIKEATTTATGNENNLLVRNLDENNNSDHDPLVVETTTGKIRGYWMRVVAGRRIRAFEGIPYAEPPLNERRFQPPLPVKSWEGIMEANQQGPKCLQYNDVIQSRVIGSENCLYLNVYCYEMDMKKNKDSLQPVLVYIHDGGFLTGSGNDAGPSYIMGLQRDDNATIFASLNYRLGVLGFMSTSDDASPGNIGLKDQSEAINWIYNNIEAFGGDPNKITLLGHGAGGVSVHMQMMSFKSRGKFIAGISISGTAFNPWALHTKEQALNLTKRFAKSLHCSIHGSTRNIVKCLKEKKGADLVKTQIQFLDTWPVTLSLFRPVVEDEFQKEDPFITETPEESYRKGTVDMIPWICGQAEDEGYSFILSHRALGTFHNLRKNWNSLASDFLNYNDLPVHQEEITRRVNWLYFRRTNPESASIKIYTDAVGARLMQTGIHKALQAHSQYAETYAFMFGYKGKYNLGQMAGIKQADWAIGHGEILGYILNNTNTYPGFKRNDSELVLSKIIVNLFQNFANNQVPSFTTPDGKTFHLWDRITDPRNMSFLHIDKTLKMIPEPYLQQTLYWESLGLPDSMPLANFSNEIQNVSDPLAKGFVSTDISINGGLVPDGLKPPLELSGGDSHIFYSNNVSNVNASSLIREGVSSTPRLVSIIASDSLDKSLPTTTTQTTITITLKPFRWISQDFQSPSLLQSTEPPTLSSVYQSTSKPSQTTVLRTNLDKGTQSQRGNHQNQNIFSAFFNAFNQIQVEDGKQRGVSSPIVAGPLNSNFLTKSNIANDYSNNLHIAKNVGVEGKPSSSSSDEIMVMAP